MSRLAVHQVEDVALLRLSIRCLARACGDSIPLQTYREEGCSS